jgi:predicted dienelactone hydrolase
MRLGRSGVALALLPILLATGCGGDDEEPAAPNGARSGRLFEYAAPDALGRFPVGFVTMPFVDESRPELATADAADHRTLPSVVWYPAKEATRSAPRSAYKDFFSPALGAVIGALAPPGFLDTASNSARDAEVGDEGPYPLIVFSHGNSGLGVQSFFLTEYLASHGYVVVCPDHTGNSLVTELPGGLLVNGGAAGYTVQNSLTDRPLDVSFLVDRMTELDAADPDGRFTGKIDLEHVGLTGHSFGGLTTLLAMESDPRFDAGAPMAPAAPESSNIDRPVMFFTATEDKTLENAPTEANYRSLPGPKMWISVIDAGHFSFSNGCPLGIGNGDGCGTATRANGETFTFLLDARVHAITSFYQTALFGHYLKGITRYADDLRAEPFSADAKVERERMP